MAQRRMPTLPLAEGTVMAIVRRKRVPMIRGHIWVGIDGHDDDPECSICGEAEEDHEWSSR